MQVDIWTGLIMCTLALACWSHWADHQVSGGVLFCLILFRYQQTAFHMLVNAFCTKLMHALIVHTGGGAHSAAAPAASEREHPHLRLCGHLLETGASQGLAVHSAVYSNKHQQDFV